MALVALHFARSYRIRVHHKAILRLTAAQHAEAADQDERLFDLFSRDAGHAPQPGDLSTLVLEGAARMDRENRAFVESVERSFQYCFEYLIQKHPQRARASSRSTEFVYADNPVVLRSTGSDRAIPGPALRDAAEIIFPVGRWMVASFANQPTGDVTLFPKGVRQVNAATIKYATRFFGCSPSIDPTASLGWPRIRLARPR